MSLQQEVGSKPPGVEFHSRLATDRGYRRPAHYGYRRIVEDTVLELHQFHAPCVPLSDFALERRAVQFRMCSGRCADVRRQWFASTLVETERVVKEEFRQAARRQPWEAAVVAQAPEGEAPIAVEAVPAEESRLGRRAGHGLDRITHELADMPDKFHHRTSIRNAAASRAMPC